MILRLLFLTGLCVAFSACSGYQLGNTKPSKLDQVETISVTLFKNKTQEQRLASLVTNSVIDEISRDGTYNIASAAGANARLEGTIEAISYRERRFDRFDSLRASEMYMEIIVSWILVNDQNRKLMSGQERGLSYFTVESNQQLSRNNAFPDAAKNAAEKITQRIANGF